MARAAERAGNGARFAATATVKEMIMLTRRGYVAQLAVAALLALTPVSATAGNTVSYAGTIRSVEGGSFVIQDVGPRTAASEMNPVYRKIVLTPSTTFLMAQRDWDGTTTFPGDYVEKVAKRSDLTDGDFVSVECRPTGDGCQAITLTIVQTGPA